MADYYPLIARAVAGLDKNTGENRRALYERARAALVAQLRGVDPPLEETEVTRERLALEESIRKVEAEAARRARTEVQSQPAPPPPSPAAAPPPPAPQLPPAPPRPPMTSPAGNAMPQRPAAPPPPPPPPSPPASRPPPSPFTVPQPPEPRKGLPPQQPSAPPPPRFEPRRAPSPGSPPPPPPPQAPRAPARPRAPVSGETLDDLRRDFGAAPPPAPSDDPFADLPVAHDFDRLDTGAEPRIDPRALRPPREKAPPFNLEPPPEPDEPPRRRGRILPRKEAGEGEPEALERSYGGIIKAAIAVVLLIGLVGFGYWQRSTLAGLYQALRGAPATQTTRPTTAPTGAPQPKIGDRIGQPGQATGPAVAQRVVLYEEEPTDPQGKRYIGSAIWRTETVSPGPGQPPELAVRADVEIPERRITMKFSIRRNTDQTLPASHTVEIMFNLPADFAGGGIANVPGILMKQSEQTRGVPLAGLAVKVMTGFFLIGLSATEADLQRNVQLLKERAWFDIPVVYGNNRRAILALEKGTPGERAFAEAFATWKQ